jgi:hypothetical protein
VGDGRGGGKEWNEMEGTGLTEFKWGVKEAMSDVRVISHAVV